MTCRQEQHTAGCVLSHLSPLLPLHKRPLPPRVAIGEDSEQEGLLSFFCPKFSPTWSLTNRAWALSASK